MRFLRLDRIRTYGSQIAFIDLLFNTLVGFVFLFVLAFIFMFIIFMYIIILLLCLLLLCFLF